MTLEHDIDTINEYMQWKAVRQDTSPEAFVRDRAQQTAYDRLSKGISYIEVIGVQQHADVGKFALHAIEVGKLYLILNGEDS